MQLEKFRNLKLAPASVHMSDFISYLNLDSEPVDESTQLVLDQLRILEHSEKLQNQIGNRIKFYLENKKYWSKIAVANGKEYIYKMGVNGAEKAANLIDSFMEKKY